MTLLDDLHALANRKPVRKGLQDLLGDNWLKNEAAALASLDILYGALAEQVGSPGSADVFFDSLRADDGAALDNLTAYFDKQPSPLGDELVEAILGSRCDDAEDFVSARSGLTPDDGWQALTTMAPLLHAFLARRQDRHWATKAAMLTAFATGREELHDSDEDGSIQAMVQETSNGDDVLFYRRFTTLLDEERFGPRPEPLVVTGAGPAPSTGTDAEPEIALQHVEGDVIRRGRAIPLRLLTGLALLAIGAAAVVWFLNRDDDGVAQPPSATTTRPAPTIPTTTASPPTTAGPYTIRSGGMLDALERGGEHTLFLEALRANDLLEDFDVDGPFTLLAPDDASYQRLPERFGDDPDELARILRYHLVVGEIRGADLTAGTLISSSGDELIVTTGFGPMINGSTISEEPIEATNGFVHPIDRVLVPTDVIADAGTLNDQLDLGTITFSSGSAVLSAESTPIIQQVVFFMAIYPNVNVVIEGHTDSDGDPAENQQLSVDRALAVGQAIVDEGIESDRLLADGFGDTMPIADNETPEGRAENRRIDFVINVE